MKYRPIFVVCEGPSEENYLQALNQLFRSESIPLVFTVFPVGTGHFKEVKRKYKEASKKAIQTERKKPDIMIWVDFDIYKRNEKKNFDLYQKREKGMKHFAFSYMNFEDFLAMHDDVNYLKWREICDKQNHFNQPMHAEEYEPLFRENIFKNYKKGEMPFELDLQAFKTMGKNSRNEKSGLESLIAILDQLNIFKNGKGLLENIEDILDENDSEYALKDN